jgi:hypothetical protein
MNLGTLSPNPWDLTLSGQNGLRGADGPLRHSGPWVGARVASQRCPVLRPGAASINPGPPVGGKKLAGTVSGRV